MTLVDLRSDTVTAPTAAMRRAMSEAEVGDDVFGDDPTVGRLESLAAERLGTQAALFVASGTQSNLVALLTHCGRGDEYVVGDAAHTYGYEGGGASVLGGIQAQVVPVDRDGTLPLHLVERTVKPIDPHFARTRLVSVENTLGGRALPLDYLPALREVVDRHGLALHLDGARLMNAAVHHGVDPTELTRNVDTVSLCLSKGLGAPVGSVLAGPAEFVAEARRWRKVVGGGMRQAGVIAAAGIVALDHHVDRLADDHANATRLADGLGQITGVEVVGCHTNMVFARFPARTQEVLVEELAARGVKVLASPAPAVVRFVTHLDVDAAGVDRAVAAIAEVCRGVG